MEEKCNIYAVGVRPCDNRTIYPILQSVEGSQDPMVTVSNVADLRRVHGVWGIRRSLAVLAIILLLLLYVGRRFPASQQISQVLQIRTGNKFDSNGLEDTSQILRFDCGLCHTYATIKIKKKSKGNSHSNLTGSPLDAEGDPLVWELEAVLVFGQDLGRETRGDYERGVGRRPKSSGGTDDSLFCKELCSVLRRSGLCVA